jgi:hypothetical protein
MSLAAWDAARGIITYGIIIPLVIIGAVVLMEIFSRHDHPRRM